MPESPDFELIARHLHTLIAPLPRSVGEREIVEQLRLVWNARGAADIALIDPEGEGYANELLNVRDALRTLDR